MTDAAQAVARLVDELLDDGVDRYELEAALAEALEVLSGVKWRSE